MDARDRPEFTPPPEPGLPRSIALAVLAHVVLLLALSWGLRWKSDDTRIAVEAELWSAATQQAAPKAVETPPPPPQPEPPPRPQPKAEPPKVEQPPVPTPEQRDAEIALEREKQRQVQEKARQEEAERQKRLAEQKRRDEEKKLAEQKRREEEKKLAEQKRRDDEKKLAEQKRRDEEKKLAEQKRRDEERVAKLREENLKRIQGLAGATGGPSSTGTALKSSGPSDSYAGRIRARVRPNIVFTDDVPGNPVASVEVRLAPDGTIVGTRLLKSSGIKSWDDAVLRALDRTQVLPRDVDGRVHTPMELLFRPRD